MHLGKWENGEFVPPEEWRLVQNTLSYAGRFMLPGEIRDETGLSDVETIVTLDHMDKHGSVLRMYSAGNKGVILGSNEQRFHIPRLIEIRPARRLDRLFEAADILQVDYDSVRTSFGLPDAGWSEGEMVILPHPIEEVAFLDTAQA